MKIVILIARLLLGLTFVVLGLNGFLNFLSMGPMPTGLAGQFISALILSHYFWVVAALQVAGGALLLVSRYVPLALVLLGLLVEAVAGPRVATHELAVAGHPHALGDAFPRLQLRHWSVGPPSQPPGGSAPGS